MQQQNNVHQLNQKEALEFIPSSHFGDDEVEWLSRGRIPLGALTILAGDPGLGKTQYGTFLAAALSTGMTSGALAGRPSETLFASIEDDPKRTIKPRLELAGAVLDRVHLLGKSNDGLNVSFTIPDDIQLLRDAVEHSAAKLLFLDPLVGFFPSTINADRNQDVRRALAPLVRLAEDFNIAVVCVNHLTKGDSLDILKRISGSGGLVAAARSVLFFGRDPSNPTGNTRILSHEKCNVGKLAETQKFEVEQNDTTSKLKLIGTSPFTAMDSLDLGSSPQEVERRQLAVKFLKEELMFDAQSATDIRRIGGTLGLGERELAFARKETGASYYRDTVSQKWMLYMPQEEENG